LEGDCLQPSSEPTAGIEPARGPASSSKSRRQGREASELLG
jgi:hypothetical protein